MPFVNFQGSDACGIINRGILVALDFLPFIPFKDQEFNIHLDVASRNLIAVAFV
jgi:hypothetical protein